MTIRSLVLAVAVIGCDGVNTNPERPDAAVMPDTPDAAEVPLTPHHYIISGLTIPESTTQARAMGLDLNGDATEDNQLGMVLAVLAGQGFDVQAPAVQSVDRGTSLDLIDFGSNGFTTSPGSFTLFSGTNPQPPACNGGTDTVCRRHLTGTGSFMIAASSAHDEPLTGQLSGGTFLSNQNDDAVLHFTVGLAIPPPVTLNLVGARVKVTNPTLGGIASGVIAGAITQSDIDTKLLPAWEQSFNADLAADCPGAAPTCSCIAGSRGKLVHDLFDTAPNNCTVTVAELKNNSLIKALLAPDVTFNGQQALSFGVEFVAVKASFAAP